jgi:hypothetical protein
MGDGGLCGRIAVAGNICFCVVKKDLFLFLFFYFKLIFF